jgi:hypothetical protein
MRINDKRMLTLRINIGQFDLPRGGSQGKKYVEWFLLVFVEREWKNRLPRFNLIIDLAIINNAKDAPNDKHWCC